MAVAAAVAALMRVHRRRQRLWGGAKRSFAFAPVSSFSSSPSSSSWFPPWLRADYAARSAESSKLRDFLEREESALESFRRSTATFRSRLELEMRVAESLAGTENVLLGEMEEGPKGREEGDEECQEPGEEGSVETGVPEVGPGGRFWYYTRQEPGAEFPSYYRYPREPSIVGGPLADDGLSVVMSLLRRGSRQVQEREELVLDVDGMARAHEEMGPGTGSEDGRVAAYMHIGMMKLSPCEEFLAYTLDSQGFERYSLLIKPLSSTAATTATKTPWHGGATHVVYVPEEDGGGESGVVNADWGFCDPLDAAAAAAAAVAAGRGGGTAGGGTATSREPEAATPTGARRLQILYTTCNSNGRPDAALRHRMVSPRPGEIRAEDDGGGDPFGLGNDSDDLLFSEPDEAFFLDVLRCKDGRFVTINSNSKVTSEVLAVDAAVPDAQPRLVHARVPGSVCFVEHHGEHFYAVVNGTAEREEERERQREENYTLVRWPDSPSCSTSSSATRERETVVGRAELGDTSIIDDLDVFSSSLVLYERDTSADASSGPRLRIVRLEKESGEQGEGKEREGVQFEHILAELPAGAATVSAGSNAWFHAAEARVSVASPLHADVACACPLPPLAGIGAARGEGQRFVARALFRGVGLGSNSTDDESDGGSSGLQDASGVDCEVVRLLAPSPGLGGGQDPASIPITVIRPANTDAGPSPLLLHVYGAYGQVLETSPFRPEWAPLLARGWTLAFAHVRGGGERGTDWHAAGRRLRKENTFIDLEAAAEHLCDQGLTEPSLLAAHGTSAGGLALGVIARRRPDLFGALVMRVPFLDVSGTMRSLRISDSDDSSSSSSNAAKDEDTSPAILAVHEVDEWGDPSSPAELACIEGYCPMLALEREGGGAPGPSSKKRPAILVTAATNDQRVPFHEPVQWVWGQRQLDRGARGGDCTTPMLLNVRYGAGHFGAGGRAEQNKEAALEQAFLHSALGLETF